MVVLKYKKGNWKFDVFKFFNLAQKKVSNTYRTILFNTIEIMIIKNTGHLKMHPIEIFYFLLFSNSVVNIIPEHQVN